jgi:hypothetical protein
MLAVFIDHLADDLFRLSRSFAGGRQRRISRQPNIHVRKIREILREKLRLQLRHENTAADKKQQRTRHHFPTIVDGPVTDSIILCGETFRSSFRNRHLKLRFEQVVAQQRDERHRYESRCDQRTRNNHRQCKYEFTGRTFKHKERKISNDIRDRRVKNCRCEFGWSKPRCNYR